MPSVCCYFEVHQPHRIRSYDVFQIGRDHHYFDDGLNREVMKKVADKCYLPATAQLLRLIERFDGRFRVAFSLTGVVLEQMQLFAPQVIDSFRRLVDTGCVELLSETYHHSLASIYDPEEFRAQIAMHTRLMRSLFDITPTFFRNTELIYDDDIGRRVRELGYRGMLAEGADDILGWRSPNFVYRAAGSDLRLLLKNYRLSDDVAFRFSNRAWPEFPLTADKFADWIHAAVGDEGAAPAASSDAAETSDAAEATESRGDTVNLFMDFETFGEHQWAETGIFAFLEHFPAAVLARPGWSFCTPTETIARYTPRGELSFPRTVSWADAERDLTAWNGNDMQTRAIERIHALGERIKRRNNPTLLALWRKLTTSDHFYYMCTKWFSDGDVHAYFSPYESPYEAFINYMNALTDLEGTMREPSRVETRRAPAERNARP